MSQDYNEYQYTNITGTLTTQVATGKGKLHAVTINTAAAGSVKLIDGTAGTTANIGTIKSSAAEGNYIYDTYFATGLRIVTAANTDLTISWKQG